MISYRQLLADRLHGEDRPTQRVIIFLETLGEILKKQGSSLPIVVGGAAVEIYTHGRYMSHDIDLLSDYDITMRTLTEMGFENEGRSLMYSEEFDILVDWQGGALDEGPEAHDRVMTITNASGDPFIRLISIVDLVIDRLEAYKFGGDIDAKQWAQVLLILAHRNELPWDAEVLIRRAEEADVKDVLEEIWEIPSASTNLRP